MSALRVTDDAPSPELRRVLHRTIAGVRDDMDALRFNTAVAKLIELTNALTPLPVASREAVEPLVLMVSPFAPHLAEELWQALGHKDTLAYESWPPFDPGLTKADAIEVPVQVNGKLRSKVTVPADSDEAALKQAALADDKIRGLTEGKALRKVIVVPGKLVNIVVGA